MEKTLIRVMQSAVATSGLLRIHQIGAGVGVILYCSDKEIGAGLHILAPDSGPRVPQNPIMYANTAIPYILGRLREKGGTGSLSVAVAGGSVMLGGPNSGSVGPKTVEAVQDTLQRAGLFIKIHETGGTKIRSIILDIDAGKIQV